MSLTQVSSPPSAKQIHFRLCPPTLIIHQSRGDRFYRKKKKRAWEGSYGRQMSLALTPGCKMSYVDRKCGEGEGKGAEGRV